MAMVTVMDSFNSVVLNESIAGGSPRFCSLYNLHMDDYLHVYHYPLTQLKTEANGTAYYETLIKMFHFCLFQFQARTEYDVRRMSLLSPLGLASDKGLHINKLT